MSGMGQSGDRPPTVEIVDALGHDLPAMTAHVTEQTLGWLDLEAACGDLSPGLAELRDRLREDVENDA